MSEDLTATHARMDEKRDFDPDSGELIILDRLPTVVLPIGSLLLDNSPRQDGENDEHIRVLAESEERLPPIVVHDQSMRVIDGLHRVRAAVLRGYQEIEAKIYRGTDDDAFMLAVRLNIAHGLPLSRADRIAAAIRIIGSHPEWSNRMIAITTGLAAGTVGKLRRRSTVHGAQSTRRVGRDGRVRPLDSAPGRRTAGELLVKMPTASIRVIAKEAGVSPSTVHDVRQRLRAGHESIPDRQRARGAPRNADVAIILANLKRDPSLRFSDPGRCLLRLLHRCFVGLTECNKIVEMVPDHCASSVANLVREYARVWTELAAQLDKRRLERSP